MDGPEDTLIPIYLADSDPQLFDPIDDSGPNRWFPEGMPARLLVVCIQACKDILKIGSTLSQQRPSMDRRGMTLLATPILSLLENTVQLHKGLGREDRSDWPARDVENFTSVAKKLRKESDGPIRKLRNARSGHHDPGKLQPDSVPRPTPEVLLPPLSHALFILTLAFNHKYAFQWIRVPDESQPDVYDYFLEMAARVRVEKDADGHLHPREFLCAQITKDPRHEAFEVVEKTIALCNHLALDAGYPQWQIVLSPTERRRELT